MLRRLGFQVMLMVEHSGAAGVEERDAQALFDWLQLSMRAQAPILGKVEVRSRGFPVHIQVPIVANRPN